jgi:hypothetical protein
MNARLIDHPQYIEMRDGTIATDPRLDRLVQQDPRNRAFPAVPRLVESDAPFESKTWRLDEFLDQGEEGACVGFGCTHELIADPVEVRGLDAEFARVVYWEAQKIDPWAGGSYAGASPYYEGTSTLAGVQILERMGYVTEYRWAFTVDDMRRVLAHYGPVILGVNWYSGMYDTDRDGYVNVKGYIAGGHLLLVIGVDEEESAFILHNSWGKDWGVNGRAKISFEDMAQLLYEQGEACVPVVRADPNAEEDPAPEEPAAERSFFRASTSRVVHANHKGIRQDIWYATLAESGYPACKVCKPKEG